MKSLFMQSNIRVSNSLSSSEVFLSIITRFPADMIRSYEHSALSVPMLHCDNVTIKGMRDDEQHCKRLQESTYSTAQLSVAFVATSLLRKTDDK